MSFAKRMQAVGTKLLNKFDESKTRLILVKPAGEPVWDDNLAEMVAQPSTEINLVGVTVAFSAGKINNTTIQNGDVMVIAANKEGLAISLQDKVKIDGVQWSIVDEPKTDYAGINIVYKIHCRK